MVHGVPYILKRRVKFGTKQIRTRTFDQATMSSSIELINPKAESIRRAAALQVCGLSFSPFMVLVFTLVKVNTNGAMGLANVVKGNLG